MARARSYPEEEKDRYRRYSEEASPRDRDYRSSEYDRAARDMRGYAEREYAERQHTEGSWSGPYVGKGPKGYKRSDQSIQEDVCGRLTEHGEIDASDIDVEVHDAGVTLKGFVMSRQEKRAAEDVAESVSGVRDVRNELNVRERQQRGGGFMGGEWREREDRNVGSANLSVFGIYRDRASVERAVDALKSKGFRSTDISALFPQNEGTKDFAFEKGTKAPEGATTGGTSGMVVGGVLGWLVGIGSLAIPGIGPLIAAGPIVATLAGAGVGGAVGGITGALVGMGMPEYEAKRYEGRVKSGHILLSIHSDDRDWARKAEEILDQTGAYDISRTGEKSGEYAESDRPMPRDQYQRR